VKRLKKESLSRQQHCVSCSWALDCKQCLVNGQWLNQTYVTYFLFFSISTRKRNSKRISFKSTRRSNVHWIQRIQKKKTASTIEKSRWPVAYRIRCPHQYTTSQCKVKWCKTDSMGQAAAEVSSFISFSCWNAISRPRERSDLFYHRRDSRPQMITMAEHQAPPLYLFQLWILSQPLFFLVKLKNSRRQKNVLQVDLFAGVATCNEKPRRSIGYSAFLSLQLRHQSHSTIHLIPASLT
jgi:hypothetical protein